MGCSDGRSLAARRTATTLRVCQLIKLTQRPTVRPVGGKLRWHLGSVTAGHARHMVLCGTHLVTLVGFLTTSNGMEYGELDKLMPSATQVEASRAQWVERVASREGGSWDAQLRAAASTAGSRRRAQDGAGLTWKYDSSAMTGQDFAVLEATTMSQGSESSRICDDNLAQNHGSEGLCQYNCAQLTQTFFPNTPLPKTKCFLYDSASRTWPEVSGALELLSMRQAEQDWHICEPFASALKCKTPRELAATPSG